MWDRGPTFGRPSPEERLVRLGRQLSGPGFVGGTLRNAQPPQVQHRVTVYREPSATRAATVIVAPSNASDESKFGADIVLDGTGDQAGYAMAIARLPGSGGRILTTEGDAFLSAKVDLPANTMFDGYGSATKFLVEDAATWADAYMLGLSSQQGNTLRNFYIAPAESDGGTAVADADITTAVRLASGVADVLIEGVEFGPSDVYGIQGLGGVGRTRIIGNVFVETGAAGYEAIYLDDSGGLMPADIAIIGNVIIPGDAYAIGIEGVGATNLSDMAAGITVADNVCSSGEIYLNNMRDSTVVGNKCDRIELWNCRRMAMADNALGGFELQSCKHVSVSGNSLSAAETSTLASSTHCNVDGNTFVQLGALSAHILVLSGSDDCSVTANHITVNTASGTDNTYDGISIDADSDTNNVQGNTVRGKVSSTQLRYGIRVNNANCDDNLVTNNDLKNAGATANFSDAGTGTVTTAGNRT